MVSCAHYVLGPFAKDSDLRRHGEKIAERGGKNAKNRATVAVARKIAVLLHRLWTTGEATNRSTTPTERRRSGRRRRKASEKEEVIADRRR